MTSNMLLRRATFEDCDLMYEWQSQPKTRQFCINKKKPSYQEHCSWLKKTMDNSRRFLLIIEENKRPIGVIRLDMMNKDAEVSIYIDPIMYGQGIGAKALTMVESWVASNSVEIDRLTAKVMPENTASINIFKKNSFSEKYIFFVKELS